MRSLFNLLMRISISPSAVSAAPIAYVEADPAESDATTIVRNLLHGQYGRPLRVVALNVEEGWCIQTGTCKSRCAGSNPCGKLGDDGMR
jgi:hypothetical protein